jgi:hypothetical protein
VLFNTALGPGGPIGGTGVVFVPNIGESGHAVFSASLGISDGDRTDRVYVTVSRYDIAPAAPVCLPTDMVEEGKSKGIVVLRCDRTVDAQGNVVLTNEENYPYGGNEFAGILLPSRAVSVYRTDGVVVSASVQAGLRSPPAPGFATGTRSPSLTSEQLLAIATDDTLTIAG